MGLLPATYHLSGEGLEIWYTPMLGGVSVSGDLVPVGGDLPAEVVDDPALGHVVTATVLESTRNGTRVTLQLLLPAVEHVGGPAVPITAVAVLISSYVDLVGGPPPVRQCYEVRVLDGTVSGFSPATA